LVCLIRFFHRFSASYAGLATSTSISISAPSNESSSIAPASTQGDDVDLRIKYWKLAADDAKECIRLDPSFLKGYYRLAIAQMELKQYDWAVATIRQGLNIDSNNVQLIKLMRTVQQQQKNAMGSTKPSSKHRNQSNNTGSSSASDSALSAPPLPQHGINPQQLSSFDPSTVKEIQEIQSSYAQAHRELNMVQASLIKAQRELKLNELTRSELVSTSETTSTETKESPSTDSTKYYRSIGKMFVLQKSQEDVMDHLLKRHQQYEKEENELKSKIQYLQNKMTSYQKNVEELVKEHQQSTNTTTNTTTTPPLRS
jgi:chaperonin cofactor prefoldin